MSDAGKSIFRKSISNVIILRNKATKNLSAIADFVTGILRFRSGWQSFYSSKIENWIPCAWRLSTFLKIFKDKFKYTSFLFHADSYKQLYHYPQEETKTSDNTQRWGICWYKANESYWYRHTALMKSCLHWYGHCMKWILLS